MMLLSSIAWHIAERGPPAVVAARARRTVPVAIRVLVRLLVRLLRLLLRVLRVLFPGGISHPNPRLRAPQKRLQQVGQVG